MSPRSLRETENKRRIFVIKTTFWWWYVMFGPTTYSSDGLITLFFAFLMIHDKYELGTFYAIFCSHTHATDMLQTVFSCNWIPHCVSQLREPMPACCCCMNVCVNRLKIYHFTRELIHIITSFSFALPKTNKTLQANGFSKSYIFGVKW